MKTLMDESSQRNDLYDVSSISYNYFFCNLQHHASRLYLFENIYNTKYGRHNYRVGRDIVTVSKPNLYYVNGKSNNYKYHFGLRYNSKSPKTLYERDLRI